MSLTKEQSFRFLDLPPELRNRVYDFVIFNAKNLGDWYDEPSGFFVTLLHKKQRKLVHPSMSGIRHQVFQELLSVLYFRQIISTNLGFFLERAERFHQTGLAICIRHLHLYYQVSVEGSQRLRSQRNVKVDMYQSTVSVGGVRVIVSSPTTFVSSPCAVLCLCELRALVASVMTSFAEKTSLNFVEKACLVAEALSVLGARRTHWQQRVETVRNYL